MDERVVDAQVFLQLTDADPLDAAVACDVMIAHYQARQLEAMRAVAALEPAVQDPIGQWCDPAPAEIGSALHRAPRTASRRLDLAHDLTDNLPGVLDALREGRIDLGKATDIANRTCSLTPSNRVALAEQACAHAAAHTRGQLGAWLDRQIARIDPEASKRRRKTECTKRRVWLQPEPDGMATLSAYLTAEEARACLAAVNTKAASIEGAVDPARADFLVALLTGTRLGAPIPVQVIITADGPELAGYGPLGPAHADSLCENATRIVLERPGIRLGYRPGRRLTRWVAARDRHCRFPGCRRPAANCDLDHLVPYPAGPTSETNLACLCRYHHRLKTHTDWQVRHLGHDLLQWTSPQGWTYYTSLNDP